MLRQWWETLVRLPPLMETIVPTCITPKAAFNTDAKRGQGLSREEKAAGTRKADECFPSWAGKGKRAETQIAVSSLQNPQGKSLTALRESRTLSQHPTSSQHGQAPPKPHQYPPILDAGGHAHPASPALPLQAAKPPFPPGEGSRLKILSGCSTDPCHAAFVSNPCQQPQERGKAQTPRVADVLFWDILFMGKMGGWEQLL